MNKGIKKTLFSLIAVDMVLSPLSVLALTPGAAPAGVPSDLSAALSKIITGTVELMAVVAVLFLVFGGVLYLTSSGDEGQIEKAKDTMTYALMGLFIAALAYAVVKLMTGWLTPTP